MADSSVYALNYGHPGQPFYNSELRQWLFTRVPVSSHSLRLLGSTQVYDTTSEAQSNPPANSRSSEPAKRSRRRMINFLRANPSFSEEEALLLDERISEATVCTTARFEPLLGDQLDFGHALDVVTRASLPIVVAANGASGFRLTRLLDCRKGWSSDRSIWLDSFSLEGDVTDWSGEEGLVLQVRFSTQGEKGSLLGVRSLKKITLFRPLFLQDVSSPIARAGSRSNPSSRLQANPVVSLMPDDVPFSDFSFNPWYRLQLATIDREGKWKVWQVSGSQRSVRLAYSISLIHKGVLDPPIGDRASPGLISGDGVTAMKTDGSSALSGDGWYRISWAADINTLIICNRISFRVVRIDREPRSFEIPKIVEKESFEWILDMHPIPSRLDHVLVLTTSSLNLLSISKLTKDLEDDEENHATILLSWKHFLNKADLSLSIHIMPESNRESIIILYSRTSPLAISVRLSRSEDDDEFVFSSSDPVAQKLYLPSTSRTSERRSIVTPVTIRADFAQHDNAMDKRGTGYELRDAGIQFFELMTLFDDFSVGQTLCCSSILDAVISPPDWFKVRKYFGMTSSKYVGDGFIATDLNPLEVAVSRRVIRKSTIASRQRVLPSQNQEQRESYADAWTIGNELSYSRLIDSNIDSRNLAESLQELTQQFREGVLLNQGIPRTVFETLDGSPLEVDDIWAISSSFQELCNMNIEGPETDNNRLELRCITLDSLLASDGRTSAQDTLASFYGRFIRLWLDPLPRDVPLEFRLAREQLVSRASAEIFLSLWRIRPPEPLQENVEHPDRSTRAGTAASEASSHSMWSSQSIPWPSQPGPSGLPSPMQPSLRGLSSSQLTSHPLPTPEPTPSLISSVSSASSLGSVGLTSLRQHVATNKPSIILNSTMSNLLAHWTPGEDPSAYNWAAKTQELQPEDGTEGLSSRAKKKLEKRMKRYLKRQRTEAAATTSTSTGTSDLLSLPIRGTEPRIVQSSPVPGMRFDAQALQSSQSQLQSQQQLLQAMASQVEQGRFGGRTIKKKKKRMRGF